MLQVEAFSELLNLGELGGYPQIEALFQAWNLSHIKSEGISLLLPLFIKTHNEIGKNEVVMILLGGNVTKYTPSTLPPLYRNRL